MTQPLQGNPGAGDGAAARPPGGDTCNTPPQTSHSVNSANAFQPITPMTGGEDWFEWGMGIEFGPRWDELRTRLEGARNAAANSRNQDDAGNVIMLWEKPLIVAPGGGRLGKGDKGQYMQWRFGCDGMTFLLADRPSAHRTLTSMHARADGRACLLVGAYELWRRVQEMVTLMGGRIIWDRLSRVDLCLDMPGQPIDPFAAAHAEKRYITRAKGTGYRDGSGMTLYIGAAPPLLRIYDKLAQAKSKKDGILYNAMVYRRWGCFDPVAATRVEFELTRKSLTKRGINSIADYYAKRADLADYLCTKWVRFTECVPDATHTTRASILKEWEEVHRGFLSWTGMPSGQPLDPLPRELCNVQQLFRSMVGIALAAIARQNVNITSEGALVNYIMKNLTRELGQIDWNQRLLKKLAAYPSPE